ncbi:hypothetical protein FRC98_11515 [Lujinxingia vulgaris]|uniref:Uncharacterized protein n=1 Tax=Lujinxingia vulgaris TaxID=2600176 RepID=A0A5C6X9S1_9DELT|nr:hypothetical protein [Lujinxingia vulgaris]TXD36463.1 hypothetical protein FRC98_11515 [Lujinxingia vulgaris]
MRHDLLKMLGLTVAVGGVVACGPSEDPQLEEQPVDALSVRQAVSESAGNSVDAVAEGLAFLGESSLFHDYVWSNAGGDECAVEPVDPPMPGEDPIGEDPIVPCEPEPVEPFEPDFEEERDEIRRVLEEHIFADANVETASETEVTYLLRGEVVCADEDEADIAECEEEVDALEIRLQARSFVEGEVDIDVMVGPDRISPLALSFAPSRVSADVDLAKVKEAVEFGSVQLGEDLSEDIPETMVGRLSAEFSKSGDEVALSVAVGQAIELAGEMFSVNIAASPRALEIRSDIEARKLSFEADLDALDLSFPTGEVEECYDVEVPGEPGNYEFTCEVVQEAYQAGAALAGIKGALSFLAAEDRLELRGFGLGASPAQVFVEGEEVAALDFNAAHGHSLDLDLAKDGDDIAISMSPGLDLELMLALYRAQDVISDLEEWMLDDVLSLVIDGDESPALRIGEAGIKLERGQLMMSSESAEIVVEVEAGMCIDEVEPAAEEPAHPMEAIGPVACEE